MEKKKQSAANYAAGQQLMNAALRAHFDHKPVGQLENVGIA